MKAVHAFSIALLLGLAAALGAVAGTRTLTVSHAQTARVQPAAVSIATRNMRLDRWQHRLQHALDRKLPKLPKLVHFARVAVPARPQISPAPVVVSQPAAAPAQRTIYVRAKAPPSSAHRHEHDHERSDGGNHDD
jgi:hypothetical protein